MKNSKIIEAAKAVAKNYREGDFFIGCTTDETLPNGRISTLMCVDCSWLKSQQSAIIERDDFDIVEGSETSPSITISAGDIMLAKWVDMIDADGDIHHCKVVSYLNIGEGDLFNPVESTDWVIYIEL